MSKGLIAAVLAACAGLAACDSTSSRELTAPDATPTHALSAVSSLGHRVTRPDGSASSGDRIGASLDALGLAAAPAAGGTTQCDAGVILPPDENNNIFPFGGLTGGTYDNIEVPPDNVCVLDGVVVTNNVTAFAGSRLFIYSSQIGGNVDGLGARVVQLHSETTVGGDVDVRNAGDLVYPFASCSVENTAIQGNLSCTGNNPGSPIIRGVAAVPPSGGDEGQPAEPVTVGGSVTLERNVIPPGNVLLLQLTSIGLNGDVNKNTGGGFKSVDHNTVVKTLDCKKNDPAFIGGPNVANKVKGQCF